LRSGRLGVNLVVRTADRAALDAATDAVKALITAAGVEAIEDDRVPANRSSPA
jgi:hypothetical protein